MRLLDLLTESDIVTDFPADDKAEALRVLARALSDRHPEVDGGRLYQYLQERERLGSTGVGEGVGIPHCRYPDLDRIRVLFGRAAADVAFDAVDGRAVRLFFLLVAPENAHGEHLKVLSGISRLCRRSDFRRDALAAADARALHATIARHMESV